MFKLKDDKDKRKQKIKKDKIRKVEDKKNNRLDEDGIRMQWCWGLIC